MNSSAFSCPKCGTPQEPTATCVKCGLIFAKYKPTPARGLSKPRPASKKKQPFVQILQQHPIINSFTLGRKLQFFRQLQKMVTAGIPVSETLQHLSTRSPSRAIRRSLRQARADLDEGQKLGEALGRYPGLFGETYLHLISFGEESGTLEQMLNRIIAQIEEIRVMRRKAFWPLVYAGYIVGGFLFFGPLLKLPAEVQLGACKNTLFMSYLRELFFNVGSVFVGLGAVILAPAIVEWFGLKKEWDRISFHVLGVISRPLALQWFFLTMHLGVSAGMSPKRSLLVACRATRNHYVMDKYDFMEALLAQGETLHKAMEGTGLFSNVTIGLIETGERTGKLEETLQEISEETKEGFFRAIKICFLIVFTVVVGFIVVRIVLAILGIIFGPISEYYNFYDTLQKDLQDF